MKNKLKHAIDFFFLNDIPLLYNIYIIHFYILYTYKYK